MTQSEYERFVTQLALLMDDVDKRIGKIIDNMIAQMEAMKKEVDNHPEHSLRNNNRQKRL